MLGPQPDSTTLISDTKTLNKITTPAQKTLREVLRHLILDPDGFTAHDAREGLRSIMAGEGTEAQQGAFLTALKLRGVDKYPEMISGLAQEMLDKAIQPELFFSTGDHYVSDIVGTGGDGWDTFNISTTASIVAASAGLKIAKHGSRASSSNCGSADILLHMGCHLESVVPENVNDILEKTNFCFIFAKNFHPSMRFLAKARFEIGFPTPFNILGPLTNPLFPKYGIIGVHSLYLGPVMADVLVQLGKRNHWVVCAECGMDEITIDGPTHIWKIDKDGNIEKQVIRPADFGLQEYPIELAFSNSLELSAEILNRFLDGANETERDKAIRTFVLLNAGALLHVSKKAATLQEGVEMAREAIDSGKSRDILTRFAAETQNLSKH
ncbi:hypothetical protein BB558_003629 [Smittium angustum]|uniref:Anthranilate phosphoribosyltransferase n=1 Tax=Smittium angustum TaxID=133377 RepID=A0A2U1J5F4_SMIAN|nr:hypothetical protein BB558_003629 [Smittium angustum]